MNKLSPRFAKIKQAHVMLSGPSGQLEALTTWPTSATNKVAIICHPHPQFAGTMHNKVVTTLAKAFDELGCATVRFNYRGVGKSEGEYGQMQGEIEDLQAVLQWVREALLDCEVILAGFSFGAFISASLANQQGNSIKQLVSIAPAVNHANFLALTAIECPWLIVQGGSDEVVPPGEVIQFAKQSPLRPELIELPNVSHFFHGYLVELRELLKNKLQGI